MRGGVASALVIYTIEHMGAAQMQDHWALEPAWPPRRRLWAFYVTCSSIEPVVDYAGAFQRGLSGVPTLDVVEPRWLHMTVLGVGFVDDIKSEPLARLIDQATALAAAEASFDLTLAAPRAGVNAVTIPVNTTRSIVPLREGLHQAVVGCLGREPHALPLPPGGFRPHISIAYAGAGAPLKAEVDDRLSAVDLPPVQSQAGHLSLLRLERREPRWMWADEQKFPFGKAVST